MSASYRAVLVGADGARAEFVASAARSLVKSAAAAGLRLTTGCLQGRCAICRARLLAGEVVALRRASPEARGDPVRRPDGTVLLCSVAPAGDVEIAPLGAWRDGGWA